MSYENFRLVELATGRIVQSGELLYRVFYKQYYGEKDVLFDFYFCEFTENPDNLDVPIISTQAYKNKIMNPYDPDIDFMSEEEIEDKGYKVIEVPNE